MTIYSLDILNYMVKMLFRINVILCNESLVLERWKGLRIVNLPPARQLVFWRNGIKWGLGIHLCCWQFRYSLATVAKTALVSGNLHFLLGPCTASNPSDSGYFLHVTIVIAPGWPVTDVG